MVWVLLAHVAVAALVVLLGSRIGRRTLILGGLAPLAGVVWAVGATPDVIAGASRQVSAPWVPALGISLDLRADGFSLLMVFLIAAIGVLVFLYAFEYFRGEHDLTRFTTSLVGFSGAMIGLVLADDLLLLFLFWELTSITSYFLIGSDDRSPGSRAAALQALLVTSGAGLAMLAGIVLVGQGAGTYSLSGILAAPPTGGTVAAGLGLILIGALAKSAQVPFHFWLPGAMAAPTPVSAYLHSATMVKAGIYLVARLAPAFAGTIGYWRPLLLAVGITTMIVGAWRALAETDMKLILAHGTVSQLGLIMAVIGVGVPELTFAGVALILAHALYKAALFMVVGIVDHEVHVRDIRRLHRVGVSLPIIGGLVVTAGASMAGFPALFGYVTKEAALEGLVHFFGGRGWVPLAAVVVGTALTVAYSLRFMVQGFFAPAEVEPVEAEGVRPGAAFLAGPILLAVLTIALGVAPGAADRLVGAGGESLVAGAAETHLALWHGFGVPLALTGVGLLAGWLAWAQIGLLARVRALTSRIAGAQHIYTRTIAGLNRVAERTTGVVQSGSLPVYLGVILAATTALPGVALLGGTLPLPEMVTAAANPAQAVVVVILAGAAVGAARSARRLSAVLFLGAVGYSVAVLFVIQGAPDLALTQVLIETMFVAVFVMVLRHLPDRFEHVPWRLRQVTRVAISLLLGALATGFALTAAAARRASPGTERMVELATTSEGGGDNVVNVILTGIRGLDTVGEITVLVTAGAGVLMLVRLAYRGSEEEA